MPLCTPSPIVSHFFFQNLSTLIHCALHLTTLHSTMSGEADQASNVAGDNLVADTQSAADVGGDATTSSSSTMADQAMARKEIPSLYQY
jgi:hypothetical protein